jgi:hypothetical protein
MDVWEEIAATRRETADYLATLDDDAWNTPSLCKGWKVKDVAAHMVMPLTVSTPKLLLKMAGTGFDFDKANDKMSREIAANTPSADIVATLRGTPEMPLADAVIHSLDIRRPLNAPPLLPGNRAEAVLNFLMRGKRGFVEKKRLEGLRFEATDIDWNSGTDGKLVRGPAASLILVLSGRNDALDDLKGDGVEMLRARG